MMSGHSFLQRYLVTLQNGGEEVGVRGTVKSELRACKKWRELLKAGNLSSKIHLVILCVVGVYSLENPLGDYVETTPTARVVLGTS